MNLRILGTELRRSAAPWAGLLVLGGSLGVFFGFDGIWWQGTAGWTAQWTSMALWSRYLLALWWPLVVGVGALYGLRDARSGTSELLGTTSRPAWRRAALPAGALAGALAAGYGLLVAVGAVLVADGGTAYRPLGWLPIVLVAGLALVAGAVFGMGVARAVPSVLTPPALVVGLLLLTGTLLRQNNEGALPGSSGPLRLALLSPAVAEPRELLLTPSGPVHLGQAVWLLGVAGTGFALLVAGSRRARLLALVPVLAGAAVALAVLPGTARDAWTVDRAAARAVCAGPVCVTAAHRDRLPGLAASGGEALRVLGGALGDGAPRTVREDTELRALGDPRTPDPGAVVVDFDERAFADARGAALTRALVGRGLVPACRARTAWEGGSVEDTAAQGIAAAWALGERTVTPLEKPGTGTYEQQVRQDAEAAWTKFSAAAPAEQRARIAALREAALSCSGDRPLSLLTGAEAR
ncbi:hypothetical protein ACIQBJ_14980 [Kitasatospora sp. NPDC088391]|uniref:hypothetical protein n=1 Tax=Kitasatospora sp. NPDC088391 TaxID=3364074 RepID=UPI003811D15E